MAKKFYAVAGTNGYGVYDDWGEVMRAKPHIKKFKNKGFDNYEEAEEFFTDFMTKAKEIDQCLGVFTWEPQSYGGWKGYHKGLFDDTGKPTNAFNAFKR